MVTLRSILVIVTAILIYLIGSIIALNRIIISYFVISIANSFSGNVGHYSYFILLCQHNLMPHNDLLYHFAKNQSFAYV
jgi:hypothetical protein